MNKALLISPHFDDAILSAGQFMSERPDTVVLTVFGGNPQDLDMQTDYDAKCGFKDARDAVSVRRKENDAATALLGAAKIDFEFPDGQYGEEVSEWQITQALQHLIDAHDYDFIMGPIGLGHPDHMKVADALLKVKTDVPVYLWEDMPLRITEPELVPARLKELHIPYKPDRTLGTKGNMADKIRALSCYSSQIGTGILDPYLMYVPERFYKI